MSLGRSQHAKYFVGMRGRDFHFEDATDRALGPPLQESYQGQIGEVRQHLQSLTWRWPVMSILV
jgi:hypothetical protein